MKKVNFLTSFSNQRGYSLVESLIASAIVGIAITAFVAALSTASLAVQGNDKDVTAKNLAQTQMEDIMQQDYSSTGPYSKIVEPSEFSISINISAIGDHPANEIQKIAVTVSHDQGNTTLSTYKSNQ